MATMGRPRIEFTEEQWNTLIQLVEMQCTSQEIASVMQVSNDTIVARIREKYEQTFPEFLKAHSGKGKASLRRMQWKSARDGNVTMQIFLGKQYLGQRDNPPEDDSATARQALKQLCSAIRQNVGADELEPDEATE